MARLAWLTITLTLLLAGGAQAQTLERIRETGTFKLGYREDAAPFSFRNALGEPAGFSVELCRLVAAEAKAALGLDQITIEYVPLGTEDRFQAVQAGRVDILCGATTVTLSRRELVDFSLVIFLDGAAVLLRADGPEDLAGLAGQKIGVRGATTTEEALRNTLGEIKVAAEIAAYFGDQAILIFLAARSDAPEKLKISDRQLTFEPYALALTRGDADFRLLVDRTLARIYRTGLIDQLFTNAFGPNADQSAALQAVYLINALQEWRARDHGREQDRGLK